MSHGLLRAEENHVPDISDTLAALDQRLTDLREQISDLTGAPEPVPPPPPPTPRSLPPPTPAASGEDTAHTSRPAPDNLSGEALSEGVGRLGAQIQDLLRMRERLLNDVRALLTRYQLQLDALQAEDPAEIRAAAASLLSSESSVSVGGGLQADVPPRPAFFEGVVRMTVSGATRIQTIQVMEDSLSRIRHVEQVYIRRWHAGALWLELWVAAGLELLGELNRVLPFRFAVQSATGQEIIISLEGDR
jgi:hypothetical protein